MRERVASEVVVVVVVLKRVVAVVLSFETKMEEKKEAVRYVGVKVQMMAGQLLSSKKRSQLNQLNNTTRDWHDEAR